MTSHAALIAAVNDTKDNDTIAAIVGAYVGAIHGREKIRAKWLDGISVAKVYECVKLTSLILTGKLSKRWLKRWHEEKFC